MKGIGIVLLLNVLMFISPADAQTLPVKDAMNSFAKFSASGDIKELAEARKFVDEAYKTRSDSAAFRNNLIRALIYSSLARTDSNLTLTYTKDPVEEAKFSLERVTDSKSAGDASSEIEYINDQLKHTYLYRGNTAFRNRSFSEALQYFSVLDSIENHKNLPLVHNLALLNQELGNNEKSVYYYEQLISEKPRPEYFLVLSSLYELMGDEAGLLKILKNGCELYPSNRDLLFKYLNVLLNHNDYSEIADIIDKAIKINENNINLNYLAGFSNEMTGNSSKAEEYYKIVLNINPNNYDANYALGLLYLNLYLKDKRQNNLLYMAKYYLSKANEIDPNELKALISLSVLYKQTGERNELQKINNRINQLKLN